MIMIIASYDVPAVSIFLGASRAKSVSFFIFPVLSLLPRHFCLSFIGISPHLPILEMLDVEGKVTEINLILPE